MAEKIMMIALTPTMEDGKIVKWSKKIGDKVAQGDVICEVETDKSSMEYESLNTGTLLHIIVPEGGKAGIGQSIAIFGDEGEDISAVLKEAENETAALTDETAAAKPSSKDKPDAAPQANSAATSSTSRVKVSPLAKKLALAKGIDIASIKGSGPAGRIVVKDIEQGSFATTSATKVLGSDIEIPVEGVRAVIAQRLSESKFSAPHFYLRSSIRMENMVDLRNLLNKRQQSQNQNKVSMNAFFIKLAAEAIKENPTTNSSWQQDKIIQYASIDIGLAVDLGNGLITPIVRNCGNKGLVQIDNELQELIEKVRTGTISASEYTGATFTISNLGSFGVDEFTAIINPPGSAILAIGQSKSEPVVNKAGGIEAGLVMRVTLSCDHRVIDGSAAAGLIRSIRDVFENAAVALF